MLFTPFELENKKIIDLAMQNNFFIIPFEMNPNKVIYIDWTTGEAQTVGKKPLKRFRWQDPYSPQIKTELNKLINRMNKISDLKEGPNLQKDIKSFQRKHLECIRTVTFNDRLRRYYYWLSKGIYITTPEFLPYQVYLFSLNHGTYAVKCDKSNLLVIDCDATNHNDKSNTTACTSCYGLSNLLRFFDYKKIPTSILENTLISRSCSGGFHFIYKYHKNELTGKSNYFENAPVSDCECLTDSSIDLVCGNKVFIAPFSLNQKYGDNARYRPVKLNINGLNYSIDNYADDEPLNKIAELPIELERCLKELGEQKSKQTLTFFTTPDAPKHFSNKENQIARKIYRKHIEELKQAQNGNRNEALRDHCRNIFMFYRYMDKNADEILNELSNVASNLGLSPGEIKATLHSAMNFGLSHQMIIR